MNVRVSKAEAILGTVEIPADKSVAHRAAIIASITEGVSRVVHYPDAEDPQSTLACLRALGVSIEADEDGILVIQGRGRDGLVAPTEPIDCGNSGTTMRLLAGVLAGQRFSSTLVGDASLSRRPMERIAVPLRLMNADVTLLNGYPPIDIEGARLRAIHYPMPERSAQVKSCVLLAGLFADGETTIIESAPTRDHTERMLGLAAVDIGSRRHVSVSRNHSLVPQTWTIPRDFSAAAFFLVAGSLVPKGQLRLPGVGVNPSRAALLDVLTAMGASISVYDSRLRSGEPIADLEVVPSNLSAVDVGGDLIPNLIDEIPVLAVAATQAEGTTTIRDAAELRVKETDRIAAMAANLRAMGARIDELPDGLRIHGPTPLHGATLDGHGDHRIAMAMGVAALLAGGVSTITGAEAAAVSYPSFWKDLDAVTFANEPPVQQPGVTS